MNLYKVQFRYETKESAFDWRVHNKWEHIYAASAEEACSKIVRRFAERSDARIMSIDDVILIEPVSGEVVLQKVQKVITRTFQQYAWNKGNKTCDIYERLIEEIEKYFNAGIDDYYEI